MRSRSGDRPPTRGIQMKHWRALRPPPSGRHKSTTRQKKPYQLRQRPLPLHFWIPTQTAISVSGKISVNTFSYHVELLYNALLHSDISRCIMQTIQTSHRSSAPAMQKLRNQRRANGMRPIQIWVPDTRQPEFVSECQRQTRNIASNVTYEREIWIGLNRPQIHKGGKLEAGRCGDHRRWKGDYGSKPRPAIIIQSDIFNELKSISVLPLTSHIEDAPVFRVVIEPDKSNGISKLSQAMVDKIMPVRKEKISGIIGKINRKLMIKIESAIAIFYGIA